MPERVSGRRPWCWRVAVLLGILLALAVACSGDRPVVAPEPSVTSAGRAAAVVAAPPATVLPELPPVPPIGSFATDTDPQLLFVDPVAGDNANDGQTSVSAWASLQYGLDRLAPGQTLYLMSGRYSDDLKPGNSHFRLTVSGRDDAWIRVAAAPGQSPVLVATAGNGLEISGNYVEVSGLRVAGEGFGPDNDYGWGLLTRSNHHVRIVGNEVMDMAVGGIGSVEATNLEIVGNTVHGNAFWGPEQGSGISLWRSRDQGTQPGPDGYHDRIIANRVYGNENRVFSMWRDYDVITDGNGIIIDQADETGYTGRVLVANNVVFDNGGRAVLVFESSRVDVMFNTSYHNGRTPGLEGGPTELAAGRANDVRFLNNLAWSRPGAPALQVDGSQRVESGGNVYVTGAPGAAFSTADLVTGNDPGLSAPGVDPAAADFRPVVGSVLGGRAVAVTPSLPVDADLRSRPPSAATVGAYELGPP